MKLLSLSSILIVCLIIVSCGDPGQPETVIVEERLPVELNERDLFRGNKIMAFLQNKEKFLKESNSLFLLGINSFRNQSDLDSAEHYLRMSILKEPSARAYFELGNVNLDKKNYEDALKAYGLAEQLDYQPFSKIMYNKSCLYSLDGDMDMAAKYLEYAIQSGYTNIDHIAKDKDLAALRKSYQYEEAIEKGLRGVSDAENLYWLQFKQKFAKVDFPHAINPVGHHDSGEEWVSISFDYEKYISEMRDEQFSREVSKEFYYNIQPYETEEFVALVYTVTDIWLGEYAPDTYILATFTHEGKLIDKQVIAGGNELDNDYLAATMEKDYSIKVDIIHPTYKKNTDEHGYYENEIMDTKKVGEKTFKISPKGIINETSSKDLVSDQSL